MKKLVILFTLMASLTLTACSKNDLLKEESRVVVTADDEVVDFNKYQEELKSENKIDMTKRDYNVFSPEEAEIVKILDSLPEPLDVMIEGNFYGNTESIEYTFNVPEEIVRLSKEKTANNDYRFEIATVCETILDGDASNKEESKFTLTYPDGGLKVRRATLISLDNGMHEEYTKLAKIDGANKIVFDTDKHFLNTHVKFVVLDKSNGVIYESFYTDRVGYGLGYPREEKVILPDVEVEDYNVEYYLSTTYDFSCPSYHIKLNANEDFRNFTKATREKAFIRIDVEDIYGEYKQANMYRLDFYAPGDYIKVILPASDEKMIREDYNTHDVNFRLRYEIYDIAPFVEEPIQTTDWTYLNIKTN
ncbi:MAG: hypothetical protein MJ244_03085 [Clostridia bacterium]|nr:hypothetical protein [Clostridia bacterium]